MPSDLELAGRLVLAILLGGVIGFERELRDHPAGLRTHITVAVGSALFVIAGAYGFEEFEVVGRPTSLNVSVDRVASTVVTGIGFLGGGAILKHGATVRGLTTAGSLWVVAAIGLAVALGSYTIALVATAATLVALAGLRGPERWIERRRMADGRTLVVHLAAGADPGPTIAALTALEQLSVGSVTLRKQDDHTVVDVSVRGRHRTGDDEEGGGLAGVVAMLIEREEVESAEAT